MSSIKEYQINVSEEKIQRLKRKLELTDLPDSWQSSDDSWDQGPPVAEIRRLVNVWSTSFDWRKVEANLNKLPHFLAKVKVAGFDQPLDVHHIHKKSSKPDAIPLLFLHGWPGSFIESTKILDGLVVGDNEGSPTFHVVAPSLMDFGFSSASPPGFLLEHHAETYDTLMQMLGYDKYVIQAGDVGSIVSRFMAKQFGPSRVRAHHTNTPIATEPTAETFPELHARSEAEPITASELAGLGRAGAFAEHGNGYYKQMTTRPLTTGYSLADSPAGLLAWIYEKLVEWSDGYPWTDEEVLTWVSVYWFSTAGPHSSGRTYRAMEYGPVKAFAAASAYVDVPLGVSRFANDLVLLPRLWNHTLGPVVFEGEQERGGHFAAWEAPEGIVRDVRAMFASEKASTWFQ